MNYIAELPHAEGAQGEPPPPGVLPIMAYTGRLCSKGLPYSGFWYMKG